MADAPATLDAVLAGLTEDGRSLLRSLRARAQAAGLRERFEPGRAGRGELVLTLGDAELARLLLKAGALPRIAFAAGAGAAADPGPTLAEPREIAGLRDAAAAGERLRALAEARAAAAPQLDLFGRKRG